MKWTREDFEQDRQRYQAELDALIAEGFTEEDFRVRLVRRRMATVDRVLTDPRFGLTDEGTDA